MTATTSASNQADAAILAQIEALKSRLSTTAGALAGGSPARDVASSSSPGPQNISVFAPQSPSRKEQTRTTSQNAVKGTKFMSSQASRGVAALREATVGIPRPQSFLKHAQRLTEDASLVAAPANIDSTSQSEKENLLQTLKPGPLTFRSGCDYTTVEAYSKQRLKKRFISHADFNENVMSGRYFLTPSQLYAIREPKGHNAGTDGDYDVPVDGDFVVILTVTSSSGTLFPKKKEETTASVNDGNAGEMDWLNEEQPKHISQPNGRGIRTKIMHREQEQSRLLAVYSMRDLSDREQSSKGDTEVELVAFESHKDKNGQWKGGSRGAFEKLQDARVVGAIVAVINPRLKNKPPKAGVRGEQGDDKHVNKFYNTSKMSLMPRDAESVIIIGHSQDFGQCLALKKNGEECGAYVDRRLCGKREPVCEYHLEKGVVKGQRGRQEFTNGTSGFGGTGGGFSGGTGFGVGKGRGWNQQRSSTSASGDLTYGLDGGAFSKQTYVDSGRRQYAKDDPRSSRFDIRDGLDAKRDARVKTLRKEQEEAEMLLTLERRRSGLEHRPSSLRPEPTALPPTSSQDTLSQGLNEFNLPTHSAGALAIRDAKRTLQERKEAAAASARRATAVTQVKKKRLAKSECSSGSSPGSTSSCGEKRPRTARQEIFDSESDEEASEATTMPSSPTIPHEKSRRAPTWRHSASAIKLMGFDPLSDARTRQNRLDSEKAKGLKSGKKDSTNFLLARHGAASSALREPSLKLKRLNGRPTSNVRPPTKGLAASFKFAAPASTSRTTALHDHADDDDSDDGLEFI